MRGVYVFEVGTSPLFSNVAPGEVTDLPAERPQDPEPGRNSYDAGQQVEDPSLPFHPNYHPVHPEVVVVDDTDINVDGRSMYIEGVHSHTHIHTPTAESTTQGDGQLVRSS